MNSLAGVLGYAFGYGLAIFIVYGLPILALIAIYKFIWGKK